MQPVDPDVLAILAAVAAPLDPADIKYKDKPVPTRYIDARVVINRLNTVCPGQWSTYVRELKQGNDGRWVAVGGLTICGITHEDAGMSDTDKSFDPPKAAASDMLKRCAVRFGMAIELYGDEDQRPPEQPGENYSKPKPKNGNTPKQQAPKPASNPAKARLDALTEAAQGTKHDRPWVPARLKQQIALKVSKNEMTGPITEPQRKKLIITINGLFDQEEEPDKWRHSLLMILTGKDSADNISKAEASVLIDWAEKDPETAATEAYLAINVALEEAGQKRLPGA